MDYPPKHLGTVRSHKLKLVPFYDRTQLINETIGTLQEAITLQILVTIIVVILMLLNLKSSLLISGTLPVAVLMCFIAMKYFWGRCQYRCFIRYCYCHRNNGDMGIVLAESMVKRINEAPPDETLFGKCFMRQPQK